MREEDGNIVISRVLCGGAADRSGMLHPGDILHEINGRTLTGLTVDDVADLMVYNKFYQIMLTLTCLCTGIHRKTSLVLLCSRLNLLSTRSGQEGEAGYFTFL